MEEKVSIITPVYNASKYILKVYKSIIHQTYSNWEWIVVDDFSSDDTLDILHNIKDDRITILRNYTNKGPSYSRNVALKLATGRFITFIDSDDYWLSHFLETSINFLIKNNETLVYSSYSRVNDKYIKILPDFIAEDYIDKNRILYNCPIPMLTSIYDTKHINKIYFPNVPYREDHAMWIDMLSKIRYARAIYEVSAFYVIRKGSFSRNKIAIIKKQFYLYYNHLNFNFIKSLYYTFFWIINGIKKYNLFKFF